MPFGAQVHAQGACFRLWAPDHITLSVKIEGDDKPHAMHSVSEGWHECQVSSVGPGTRYQFILPNGTSVPDPASRFQPEDVHGPSEVVDPSRYRWSDGEWIGRTWEEMVIYEMHVGAFTQEGTFLAVIDRLDYLRTLGVTAIELMPVADFPGRRNWGYDGVLLFAPDSSYGKPDDLKALIDAAHQRGIAVLLDVVYNHFGPDGNYLPLYCPIFTDRHQTPWGAAVNYDAVHCDGVRSLIINNAVYWIREYNLDGLRLDAVHAIIDESPKHLLHEIADAVHTAAAERLVHLILENEENEASKLMRDDSGRPIQFTAQWNDDVHHVLHTAASGESAGYYADYRGDTNKLGRALAEGFAFQGELMPYRGHARGQPSSILPPTAFISFIQNHDQVGNRAFGDRITAFAKAEAVRAVAAIYLLAPQIPMLFMGEEWGATQPFPFFCDFPPPLDEAVRNGRRAEFAKFPEFQDPQQRKRIPDPTALRTFLSAKLPWDDPRPADQSTWLEWYHRILTVRLNQIVPLLSGTGAHSSSYKVVGEGAVIVRWTFVMGNKRELTLAANLRDAACTGFQILQDHIIWTEGSVADAELGPWSVVWMVSSH
jgi:malto-oligosyltrehalose trehalohydrolase